MASHHFIGTGRISEGLAAAAADPEGLIATISELVSSTGLTVVATRTAAFDGGGLTLVWVLAESHLVLHYWAEEGYATIDLHVCDFRASNAPRARRLAGELQRFCFVAGSESWHELQVEPPAATPGAPRPSSLSHRL